MNLKLIDFFFGTCRLRAKGVFAERILNIANQEGIFVQKVTREDDYVITFTVSRKAGKKLLSMKLPGDLSLSLIEEKGIMAILGSKKHRRLLILAPVLSLLLLFFSTSIIWNVNIIGDDPAMEKQLKKELSDLGVKRGVFSFTVDPGEVKHQMLLKNHRLLWIWVDIRASGAIVKYQLRKLPPAVFEEESFYNLYSTRDAVITKIIATNGIARVNVGDTVLEGQLLVEGSLITGENETKPIHASGTVLGSVWEEKTYTIPKNNEIRTPTGEKTEHLTINFSKFPLKLFINSSILYQEYDIIEYNRDFPLLPVSFNKRVYHKVNVTYTDNDITEAVTDCTKDFTETFTQKGYSVGEIESYLSDEGDSVSLTLRALCEEPVAVERRMYIGENYNSTDN